MDIHTVVSPLDDTSRLTGDILGSPMDEANPLAVTFSVVLWPIIAFRGWSSNNFHQTTFSESVAFMLWSP